MIDKLVNCSTSDVWRSIMTQAPFDDLHQRFMISNEPLCLHADTLNQLKNQLNAPIGKKFVCQTQLHDETSYYEEIIFNLDIIPTRPDSWHDFFNGLVWLQFPLLKNLLNNLHYQDILSSGAHPRTPRRNRMTHFDECGVILATTDPDILSQLRDHKWHQVFVESRHQWGQIVKPFVFGHANLEMLLQPHIGLTGKWLPVLVKPDFFDQPYASQVSYIDQTLYEELQTQDTFSHPGKLSPLPLLGVPGWSDENRNADFYRNTEYFRPKRIASK